MNGRIFLSIVTPTYNQREFIKKTFDSILIQHLPPHTLEYIVVDALSTDGTKDLVFSYKEKFRKAGIEFTYIREKDKGQSDGINKGWKMTKGEVVAYLNSDDYYEKGALEEVISYFQTHKGTQWAYGGWNLVNRSGKIYLTIKHTWFDPSKLLNYCNIGQPSCFFRKTLLKKFGYLNPSLHLAFDYDLWLRFSTRHDAGMIPGILSNMRYYRQAKSSTNSIPQSMEMLRLGSAYTRLFSLKRFVQYFYFLRGISASLLGIDVTKRIEKMEFDSGSKVIALVDPISGGHHEMYLKIYSDIVSRLGYEVWIFTPNPKAVRQKPGISYFQLPKHQIEAHNLPVITFAIQWIKTLIHWWDIGKTLQEKKKKFGVTPRLVFFTWLDSYLHPVIFPWMIELLFPYPWSGLYFHPRHYRVLNTHTMDQDHLLLSKKCLSVAVLDEGVKERMEKFLGKPVFVFPDVTDVSVSDRVLPEVREIKKRAGNRKIVGIFGSLEKRKSILEFLDIASLDSRQKYFFLFAGSLQWSTFTEKEKKRILGSLKDNLRNVWFYPKTGISDAQFNGLVRVSNIISVLYKDFPHSSNLLTKAAYFGKPVIAFDQYTIGERTKKYHLGSTVGSFDRQSIIRGLETAQIGKDSRRFYMLHSVPTLTDAIKKLLSESNTVQYS